MEQQQISGSLLANYTINDLIDLYNENQKLRLTIDDYNIKLIYKPMHSKVKRKYVYLDVDTSGKFLVDTDLNIWSIAAYGQKNHFLGHINKFMEKLQEDNATLKKVAELKQKGIKQNYSLWFWY